MLPHHPVSLSLTESSPTQQSDIIQSLYIFSIQSQFISLNHLPPSSQVKYTAYLAQHPVSVSLTELYPIQQSDTIQSLCSFSIQSQFHSLNHIPPSSQVKYKAYVASASSLSFCQPTKGSQLLTHFPIQGYRLPQCMLLQHIQTW